MNATKMTGNTLLNEVQKRMVDFANSNSISLHDEFGTVEKFKTFVVAFTIKMMVDIGIEISKAYDIVMGDGAYTQLANDVWAKCQ